MRVDISFFSIPLILLCASAIFARRNQSLPPRGRCHAKRDGRSLRYNKVKAFSPQRVLPQSPTATAPSRREPLATVACWSAIPLKILVLFSSKFSSFIDNSAEMW